MSLCLNIGRARIQRPMEKLTARSKKSELFKNECEEKLLVNHTFGLSTVVVQKRHEIHGYYELEKCEGPSS